jgi:hypothetical protein
VAAAWTDDTNLVSYHFGIATSSGTPSSEIYLYNLTYGERKTILSGLPGTIVQLKQFDSNLFYLLSGSSSEATESAGKPLSRLYRTPVVGGNATLLYQVISPRVISEFSQADSERLLLQIENTSTPDIPVATYFLSIKNPL